MRAGLTVVIILLAITRTNASCFGKDATWAVNVSQKIIQSKLIENKNIFRASRP